MKKPHVLLVEDDSALCEALTDILATSNLHVSACANGVEATQVLATQLVDIVVSDINMPEMDGVTFLSTIRRSHPNLPVIMMTAFGRIDQAVEAMKLGAKDYLSKPFTPDRLVELIEKHVSDYSLDDQVVIAEDPASQDIFQLAEKVALSNSSVMILGESGTGKEVLSQFIHRKSNRSNKPFVAVNCAAIPENMLESILFGYEKGAFTGAHQPLPGKFEQANGGTLLLDEITEMDISLQAKLLRVLQEKKVERLGGKKTIDLDVRVLATSNRDLSEAVRDGVMREDLYYRLAVFPIHWLPLRSRSLDIVPLANYFIGLHCHRSGLPRLTLSSSAEKKIMAHHWPGNVRELDNVIQRSIILSSGQEIQDVDIMLDSINGEMKVRRVDDPATSEDLSDFVRSAEYQKIIKTLRANGGSKKKTAEELGISPRTLRHKLSQMRESGIDIDVEMVI